MSNSLGKALGQIAYEAYCDSPGFRTGANTWEHISRESKLAWENAALAVLDTVNG